MTTNSQNNSLINAQTELEKECGFTTTYALELVAKYRVFILQMTERSVLIWRIIDMIVLMEREELCLTKDDDFPDECLEEYQRFKQSLKNW